jgi:hypothetical protein
VADENRGIFMYRVKFPDGMMDVLSLIPPSMADQSGLAADAIIGVREGAGDASEPITAENLKPNPNFVQLLHDVIASHAPDLPALQEAAREQGDGRVYVIDARTKTPAGEVPPHDILGAFEVKDRVVVPGSYQLNTNHQLFSADGLFRLEPALHLQLMSRIIRAQRATNE